MEKPALVIMAAGMGSRYGGLKQIAPVDRSGHIIIDYSIFDAHRAGFDTVICVIKPEHENDFREAIGNRISHHLNIHYAYQTLENLPEGFQVPNGRTKPWGTAHAVLSAKDHVGNRPFAVINADDYYGRDAFASIFNFLSHEANPTCHAMVGYKIENTLTENGAVARGICETGDGYLSGITERTHIEARPGGAAYTEDGTNFTFVPAGTIVSMNMWGFDASMIHEIESRFGTFLAENLPKNPLKCEYFLPLVPNTMLKEKKARIRVLPTSDKWYGVTYAPDMPVVRAAIDRMKKEGLYPEYLWEVQ